MRGAPMAVASCPERTRIAPPREASHVIPILMYHSIAEQSEPYLRRWTVTPDAFLEHVTAMVESRRTPLTITQLAEGPRGARTLSFAYPHGSHDRRSVAAVRDAGYTSAVAVKNALSHSGDDVFALARVTIEAHTSTATVRAALDGTLRMAPRGELWRTRGYRQLRRWRRAARSRSS